MYLTVRQGLDFPLDDDFVIPHPNYRPWVEAREVEVEPADSKVDPTALVFGIVKPYKGIESAIAAVGRTGGLHLKVIGQAPNAQYAEEIRTLIKNSPGSVFNEGRVADSVLIAEISKATVVLLPYKSLYNSGALLLALSLETPVVVQKSAVAETLVSEFGSDWVRVIDFDKDEIPLSAPHASPEWGPSRDWGEAASAHNRVYRRLTSE
ncbi:glycosyltransferase [Curtobacterium sp. MCBD17_023]|uniref:glycosyltransferase n=1 Tax=Curtobacterium sp. MCBD17_023 TaxID=2175657 RepID=UPI0011B78A3A|nr:glycosyltransferase [Curtobacterium sp. MCBD17_023]